VSEPLEARDELKLRPPKEQTRMPEPLDARGGELKLRPAKEKTQRKNEMRVSMVRGACGDRGRGRSRVGVWEGGA
jgi:hypothetical protein